MGLHSKLCLCIAYQLSLLLFALVAEAMAHGVSMTTEVMQFPNRGNEQRAGRNAQQRSHKMSTPGFTAEASIYRSCARYYGDPMLDLRKGEEGMIQPALPIRTFCVRSGEIAVKMCCMVWERWALLLVGYGWLASARLGGKAEWNRVQYGKFQIVAHLQVGRLAHPPR